MEGKGREGKRKGLWCTLLDLPKDTVPGYLEHCPLLPNTSRIESDMVLESLPALHI